MYKIGLVITRMLNMMDPPVTFGQWWREVAKGPESHETRVNRQQLKKLRRELRWVKSWDGVTNNTRDRERLEAEIFKLERICSTK